MWMSYPEPVYAIDLAFSEENSPETPDNTRNWIYNTIKHSCCVRLSYSLNKTVCHKITLSYTKSSGVKSITGARGQYIYNVESFDKYMVDRYGQADHIWNNGENSHNGYNEIIKKKQTNEEFLKEIENKKGIIIFFTAAGTSYDHADLWDNGKVGSYNLFEESVRIKFWEASY